MSPCSALYPSDGIQKCLPSSKLVGLWVGIASGRRCVFTPIKVSCFGVQFRELWLCNHLVINVFVLPSLSQTNGLWPICPTQYCEHCQVDWIGSMNGGRVDVSSWGSVDIFMRSKSRSSNLRAGEY
jgi:hypothetical protein